MGDRTQVHSQLEHLQAKYVGTGHADTTKFDWAVNQHRDSYALYVGMDSLSMYFAIAENESVGRVKFSCLQVGAHAVSDPPEFSPAPSLTTSPGRTRVAPPPQAVPGEKNCLRRGSILPRPAPPPLSRPISHHLPLPPRRK